MATAGETENDIPVVSVPPLKKRTTKRGLARTLALAVANTTSEEANSSQSSLEVYSNCVERNASLIDIQPTRVPLNLKNDSDQDTVEKSTARAAESEPSTVEDILLSDDEDDVIDVENSELNAATGDDFRSPSPPVPPPPKIMKQPRRKRMDKGVKKAFETLGMVKGELRVSKMALASPVVIDDSPGREHDSDSLIVRIRHMADIHRFSMAKTEMFYGLQSQMAELLKVETDQVGLYLRDVRLAPTDTPQSSKLHLADIIECHVLVPEEKGQGQGDGQSSSEHTARVLMQCPSSRDNVHMVVKKYVPFKDMMVEYAGLRGKPLKIFRFKFDGELLSPDMMPTEVDLDDGDTIDVIEVR